jgi:glycosyltransferase involved in cell wall biosynthesis
MKIALFDPYNGKFTNDMVEWWQSHGYEVKREPYYNPELVVWGDVVFFHTCDNNLLSATNPDQALKDEWKYSNRPGAWDMHEMDLTGKKIIVQPIDIECWGGAHANSNMWNIVTDCIFIAPHIRDMVMVDSRPQESNMKIHTIPFSINPDKWTFKERKPGFNIAVVAETWESKGIDYVLQISLKLKQIDTRYNITYVGKNQDYNWHQSYRAEFIKNNELPIKFVEWVDNLDEFLEDKNYFLHCSIKEAFSAATAESAAKGLRPILHAFYGYEPLWGDSGWIWQGIDEAVDMIKDGQYDSHSYRQYLYDKGYTTSTMMEKIQAVIDA